MMSVALNCGRQASSSRLWGLGMSHRTDHSIKVKSARVARPSLLGDACRAMHRDRIVFAACRHSQHRRRGIVLHQRDTVIPVELEPFSAQGRNARCELAVKDHFATIRVPAHLSNGTYIALVRFQPCVEALSRARVRERVVSVPRLLREESQILLATRSRSRTKSESLAPRRERGKPGYRRHGHVRL